MLQQGKTITLTDGREISPDAVQEPAPKARMVVIGGDNDRPEILHDVLTRTDLLVHEATFSTPIREKVGGQWMHSTPAQVAEAAERAGVKHIILTHFSNRYQRRPKLGQLSLDDLKQEAQAVYSGTVTMAADHCSWELTRSGQLLEV